MSEQQTQENLVMVLKMITGEKIVAEFIEEESSNQFMVINKPLQLHSAIDYDQETGEKRHYNYFHIWNQLTEDEKFYIPYEHIITANMVASDVKYSFDKYCKMIYNNDESESKMSDDDDDQTYEYESIDMSQDDAYEFILKSFSANNAYMN